MKKTLILLCGLALLIFVGCVQTGQQPSASLPNPASQFCLQNGGQLDIRETAAGQYGVCLFADGSECDEWSFFRGECRPGDSIRPATPELPVQRETWTTCRQYLAPGQVCPFDYAPVCAKVEMTTGTRWLTFKNECLACKMAQRPATTITYKEGACEQ